MVDYVKAFETAFYIRQALFLCNSEIQTSRKLNQSTAHRKTGQQKN